MGDVDTNIWGILAMPVGLSLCFGPALLAWVLVEKKNRSAGKDKGSR